MIAMERGEHRRAMSLHREALTLRTESADDWGVAASLIQLGIVAGSMRTDDTARQHLRRALRIAWENSVVPVVLEALIELTALATRDSDSEGADSALAAIAAHPALPGQLRPRLASLMMDAGIEPAWPDPTADDDRWAVREVDAMARAAISYVVEIPR
jgi:hypothetical protein